MTGIWDLNRDSLDEGWSRSFDHYKEKFSELLKSIPKDVPLIVFIDKTIDSLVWEFRSKENTVTYNHSKEDFNGNFFPFFNKVQEIRTNEEWRNLAGWLGGSTQARLEYYNPMVMSKMFLLHNAKIYNPFNTEYIFWIDGGITNTVHPGYFSHDNVLSKLEYITEKMLFICFSYEPNTEIHGFEIEAMKKFCKSDGVNRVARGGLFGGHIDYISEANNLYYSLLNDSLDLGLMGTEESIFTIMTYLDPDVYQFKMIESNGLISKFFEDLKNTSIEEIQTSQTSRKPYINNKISLYINAFNFPEQLQMVLDSFNKFDKDFINKTEKILINNSTDQTVFGAYDDICNKYNFSDHIKKGNLGICRARQFAAEHFNNSGNKYMMFFEDDMLLDFNGLCNFGFTKNVPNLLNTVTRIMDNEKYDFLKFSFSEFYGTNGEQWVWHNVPSHNRIKYFGNINKRPHTKFHHIKNYKGIPYAEGEIYYCNWPHIIDQEGNQKLFLDTTWANPFEQTWMSHIYDLTIQNTVKAGILLASPITHNRVHFYEADQRREN